MRIPYPYRTMRNPLYAREPNASRRAVNLTAHAGLLDEAKRLGLNLSAVFEFALEQAVRAKRAEVWLAANREAIDAYNEHIEKHGAFSDGLRSF